MEWSKGEIIGIGAFAKIYLANPRTPNTPLMAVKSAMPIDSSMLHLEKDILTDLSGCPQIINCYGDDTTVENGKTIYNVFLELAPNGDLSKRIAKNSPHNILIFPTQDGKKNDVKITDFGLAKRTAWKCDTDAEARSLLYRIGFTKELPEIPHELSEQGKDLLGKCWERDCSKRWTAEMPLNHPFVAEENDSDQSFRPVADKKVNLESSNNALSVH
ncbi:hypothetical protein Scep_001517 [Stephania cephalantha]|uniref:Protein kinase domain-containing protein n=1 Tax=Stephania cephalantha TaxID=152367 RepID=A0AAP0L8B9_9MAGN